MEKEIQESLSQFGLSLNKNYGLSDVNDDFSLTIEQIPLCYQVFNNSPSIPLGFLHIIPKFVFEKWNEITIELHQKIKTLTLDLISNFQSTFSDQINVSFLFSQYITDLFIKYQQWPELLSLLLQIPDSQTNSNLNDSNPKSNSFNCLIHFYLLY